MLDSKKTILPVFYDYAQCTRGDRGVYARALADLEKKTTSNNQTRQIKPCYPLKTIQEWRRALSQAANRISFELAKYNGDHDQLIRDVVENILKIVKRPVHVAKYPISLDQKVGDFEMAMSLQPHSGETRVIGIVGPDRVGNTTLTIEIFNNRLSYYDRSCRLSDIRENSLESSQGNLLADLAGWNEKKIKDINDGITQIKRYLSSPSALVLLDNVDDIRQLNALLVPMTDTVELGSLILITSRNEDVLRSSGIGKSSIYKLKGLDLQHSRELFCWHVFDQSHPVQRFAGLVDAFIKACHGLPLSLKVNGASFHGEDDLRLWRAHLSKIYHILPNEIQARLKIAMTVSINTRNRCS